MILHSSKSILLLAKKMKQDLKKSFTLLEANNLSLNVKKTELIIFHPQID